MAEVMADIAQAWNTFRNRVDASFGVFDQVITQARSGSIAEDVRQEAIAVAHRLIGSLGSFSLPEGSELARQLERSLESKLYDQAFIDQFIGSVASLKRLVKAHALPLPPVSTLLNRKPLG